MGTLYKTGYIFSLLYEQGQVTTFIKLDFAVVVLFLFCETGLLYITSLAVLKLAL